MLYRPTLHGGPFWTVQTLLWSGGFIFVMLFAVSFYPSVGELILLLCPEAVVWDWAVVITRPWRGVVGVLAQ
jgi:hypothetical protein